MGSSESAPREVTQEMLDERKKLLSTPINKISLIMQPSNKFMLGYEIAVAGVSMILPANMTCAHRNHIGIFVFGENDSYDGVFMEFGPFDQKNEKDVNACVHYHRGEDGLRFFSAYYSNIDGFKFECEVEYKMTINTLLNGLAHYGWSKKDYEEVHYEPILDTYYHRDSKDFAIKVIKTLGAKRIKKSDRIRTFCKTCIPGDIIDSLEDNENCNNLEERIPIVGTVAGIIKIFTTED